MSKNIKACLSHDSDNWRTPSKLYDYFINYLGCVDMFEYCSKRDQYEINYQHELLFCNPPYSQINSDKFYAYIYRQYLLGYNTIYLLIPSRTDTNLFHKLVNICTDIYFFKGRLRFNDSACAPFPSCIIRLDHDDLAFHRQRVHFLTMQQFIDWRCQ